MELSTQQRVDGASSRTTNALRKHAAENVKLANDLERLKKVLDGDGSEAGDELAEFAYDRIVQLRNEASANIRRADHIQRYGG